MRFLFVDRITHSSPGEIIRGVKHITSDDAYLCQEEGGRPYFIPSLIGETLGQLAAWNVMQCNQFKFRPVAGIVSSAQLHQRAYLGDTLFLESFIDVLDEQAVQYHAEASVRGKPVFTLDGALGPLLPMEDFIEESEVRSQYAEIYRPVDEQELSTCAASEIVSELGEWSGLKIAPMRFDRIIAHEPGLSLQAEKRVTRSAPYFPDHFPKKPVLPMTVLLECKLNLADAFLEASSFARQYQIRELRKIKMNEFVYPGDIVHCTLLVKKRTEDELVLTFRSEVAGRRVCVLDMVFIAKR